MQINRENFPLFYASHANYPKTVERFENMLEMLQGCLDKGSIRNVELKDVKDLSARAAEVTRDFTVSDPYFRAGKWEEQSTEVNAVRDKMLFSGIASLINLKKHIDKLSEDTDCTRAMKAWVNEFLPLAQAVTELKTKVVMGRAPSTEPAKPVNPNKDVKTCPCCFRAIAVVAGTMAHHGYKRPQQYMQTASCPGINFKPLELSPDGLHYMLKACQNGKAQTEKLLADAPKMESFTVKGRNGRPDTILTAGSWEFDQKMTGYKLGLERDIRDYTRDIATYEHEIAVWAPGKGRKRAAPEADAPAP